jgi:hypothetical protein
MKPQNKKKHTKTVKKTLKENEIIKISETLMKRLYDTYKYINKDKLSEEDVYQYKETIHLINEVYQSVKIMKHLKQKKIV